MAKRKDSNVDDRLVEFAETLGRMVGTIQGRAGGLVDTGKMTRQLAQVRDTAAHLVEQLGQMAQTARRTKKAAPAKPVKTKGRSGGMVDAPGKKHRAPMPSDPRAKHASSKAAKVRVVRTPVAANRRRGRG